MVQATNIVKLPGLSEIVLKLAPPNHTSIKIHLLLFSVSVLSWNSLMEYIRSLQRSSSKEEIVLDKDEEGGEMITDSAEGKMFCKEVFDNRFIDFDYIDEVQLKVRRLSIEQ